MSFMNLVILMMLMKWRFKVTNKIKYIAEHYGRIPQLEMLQEECAELIQAVSKYKRYGKFDNVIEEISDVEIIIEQIKYLFVCGDEVETEKIFKINRQIERINNG